MKFYRYLKQRAKLDEALPLSVAKEMTELFNKARYANAFDGKSRIYLELDNTEEVNIKPPKDIEEFLQDLGYEIVNYAAGLAQKKGSKNLIRIGKILNNPKNEKELSKKGWADGVLKVAAKKFQQDPARQALKKKDMLVVISRHPYDIAGMSADRGWTSCMNFLEGGTITKRQIMHEINAGTIVAYLINKDDPNINRPIGRIAIKPFLRVDPNDYDEELTAAKPMMVPCTKGYGGITDSFLKTVSKWVDKKMNRYLRAGSYRLHPKVYQGDYDKHVLTKMGGIPKTLDNLIKEKYSVIVSLITDPEKRDAMLGSPKFVRSITVPGLLKLYDHIIGQVQRKSSVAFFVYQLMLYSQATLDTDNGKKLFVVLEFMRDTRNFPGFEMATKAIRDKKPGFTTKEEFDTDKLINYLVGVVIGSLPSPVKSKFNYEIIRSGLDALLRHMVAGKTKLSDIKF